MPNQPEQPKSDWLDEILLSTMFNASDIQERYYKRQIESIQTVADMRKNVVEQAAAAIRSQLKERLVAEATTYEIWDADRETYTTIEAVPLEAIEKELGGE